MKKGRITFALGGNRESLREELEILKENADELRIDSDFEDSDNKIICTFRGSVERLENFYMRLRLYINLNKIKGKIRTSLKERMKQYKKKIDEITDSGAEIQEKVRDLYALGFGVKEITKLLNQSSAIVEKNVGETPDELKEILGKLKDCGLRHNDNVAAYESILHAEGKGLFWVMFKTPGNLLEDIKDEAKSKKVSLKKFIARDETIFVYADGKPLDTREFWDGLEEQGAELVLVKNEKYAWLL